MTDTPESWYVVQTSTGQCEVRSRDQLADTELASSTHWGPYDSQGEAVARRVGLIRAGKCKPA